MPSSVYVDDISEAEAVELKKQLKKVPVTRPYPLAYHERTEHVFPAESSILQQRITLKNSPMTTK